MDAQPVLTKGKVVPFVTKEKNPQKTDKDFVWTNDISVTAPLNFTV